MPLDPVIPVSTLRVWRGSHRDRARGRDDTPRGMRRRSPCQGVRLNMRGGLGITAWRAMWPLWLHTRTRSRSREGEGVGSRTPLSLRLLLANLLPHAPEGLHSVARVEPAACGIAERLEATLAIQLLQSRRAESQQAACVSGTEKLLPHGEAPP